MESGAVLPNLTNLTGSGRYPLNNGMPYTEDPRYFDPGAYYNSRSETLYDAAVEEAERFNESESESANEYPASVPLMHTCSCPSECIVSKNEQQYTGVGYNSICHMLPKRSEACKALLGEGMDSQIIVSGSAEVHCIVYTSSNFYYSNRWLGSLSACITGGGCAADPVVSTCDNDAQGTRSTITGHVPISSLSFTVSANLTFSFDSECEEQLGAENINVGCKYITTGFCAYSYNEYTPESYIPYIYEPYEEPP
jgi:hypothetical protein